MNEKKCMCGRVISKEEHTGLCQLEHFIAYTGNGMHGVDLIELDRIAKVIASDYESKNLTIKHLLERSDNSDYAKCPECDTKNTLSKTWHCSECGHSFEKRHFA